MVLSEEEARVYVEAYRASGLKVVMTNGCFDILHAGHIHNLRRAATMGNFLVVAVNDDKTVAALKGDGRPVNSLEDRMVVLDALGFVDIVVPFYEPTPGRLICELRPQVLVKGGDYRIDQIAGADCVLAAGGIVEIVPLLDGRSTTATIQKVRE